MKKLLFAVLLISCIVNVWQYKNRIVIVHPTEYHFNVDQYGYDIYTEDMKEVGRLNYGENRTLDSLINADNQ